MESISKYFNPIQNGEKDSLSSDEIDKLEKSEQEKKKYIPKLKIQPSILKGGTLKDYQLAGLNWLISLYENGINGILADGMGLGKTVQTISLIAFLNEYKKLSGPHLVVAPLSTIGNWLQEFQRWLPSAKVVKLAGIKTSIQEVFNNDLKPGKFDICVTSYEQTIKYNDEFGTLNWEYLIVDEADRIKNSDSPAFKGLSQLKANYKLLLTGAPLPNNIKELWALLSFLQPEIFVDFQEMCSIELTNEDTNKANFELISNLQKILRPFILRRTKADIACALPSKKEVHLFTGFSEMQLNLYKNFSSKKIDTEGKNAYLNMMMQLRKVCNHPYLFEGMENEENSKDEAHLIKTSGKMIVLDKLLHKLQKEGHQVLIFCQMTKMLDILEDYCLYRKYNYCRIDGSTTAEDRHKQVLEFTQQNSDKFIFLLSTRAGGLGINLSTADAVILYDSDWNPQMDVQAIDRAHKLGQHNPVIVYRMITDYTFEERMVDRQKVKLKWDILVNPMGEQIQCNQVPTIEEVKNLIQIDEKEILKLSEKALDEDIDILLQRDEIRTAEKLSELENLLKNKEEMSLEQVIDKFFEFVENQKKREEMSQKED